jgi:cbb3-type cytochrome oxidase subunit 3
MSDYPAAPARPVSLFTIVFLFILFAAFLLVVRYFYRPAASEPFAVTAENYPKEKDAAWRASSENRRKTLQELTATQQKQLTSYGWADKNAGKVHLPIDRAMELTVQQYNNRK